LLIGFIGYGGSGKSTAAEYLRLRHGWQTPHIGAPLKEMVAVLLRAAGVAEDLIPRYIDGDLKRIDIPEIGHSATYIQQTLGTQWGRQYMGKRLWLDCWCKKVDKVLAAGGHVTNESVRFFNEADEIWRRGGIIVQVKRPGVGPLPGGHVSEELPCEPDFAIWNDGAPEILHARIEGILDRVWRRG
jgi:hypothetical protein